MVPTPKTDDVRRVRVLINPKSGLAWSFSAMQQVLERVWARPDIDLTYQFSNSAEDGKAKARRAVEEGVDTVLIVGGDGMVNSIGSVLMGTDVALGVIPAGSGNGFARHFGVPLTPERAAESLVDGKRMQIDVGAANGQPFFVTCSMAWDAALVRSFDKSPVRGVLPYVFAAVYEFIGYVPQPFHVTLDGSENLHFTDPIVFTAANLTQYGGGAKIAPHACPDDGQLELVVINEKHLPRMLARMNKLFDGTIDELPGVMCHTFKKMEVRRNVPGPIQLDGELVEAPASVEVEVHPKALTILIPGKPGWGRRVLRKLLAR